MGCGYLLPKFSNWKMDNSFTSFKRTKSPKGPSNAKDAKLEILTTDVITAEFLLKINEYCESEIG